MSHDDIRLWQGERLVTALLPDDRGLTYGDGLFETVRVVSGRPVLLDRHWARLAQGARVLGIPLLPCWRDALDDFLRGRGAGDDRHNDGVLRVHVSRGPGGRGYLPPDIVTPTFLLSWHPAPSWPASHAREGIRLADASLRLGMQPVLAGIKHANRLEQVLMRQALASQPDCAEALVQDAEGRLVEGIFSNLFLVCEGYLLTPSLQRCGVQGVLRDALLDAAPGAELAVAVVDLTEADLWSADECFLANSVFGIWPVVGWRDRAWRPGPITRQCQNLIAPWFAAE